MPWGRGELKIYDIQVRDSLRQSSSEICEVVIDDVPFARGGCREAFYCKFKDMRTGQWGPRMVAKRYLRDEAFLEDYICSHMAYECGCAFNQLKPYKPVDYLIPNQILVLDGTNYGIERFLEGEWEKHNNIFGMVLTGRLTPNAFSHFSYLISGCRYIILDVQGVGDTFTDPAVVSIDQARFGYTDTGIKGIRDFFKRHICNDVCRQLQLPPILSVPDDIKWDAPWQPWQPPEKPQTIVATSNKQGKQQVRRCSAELNIPPDHLTSQGPSHTSNSISSTPHKLAHTSNQPGSPSLGANALKIPYEATSSMEHTNSTKMMETTKEIGTIDQYRGILEGKSPSSGDRSTCNNGSEPMRQRTFEVSASPVDSRPSTTGSIGYLSNHSIHTTENGHRSTVQDHHNTKPNPHSHAPNPSPNHHLDPDPHPGPNPHANLDPTLISDMNTKPWPNHSTLPTEYTYHPEYNMEHNFKVDDILTEEYKAFTGTKYEPTESKFHVEHVSPDSGKGTDYDSLYTSEYTTESYYEPNYYSQGHADNLASSFRMEAYNSSFNAADTQEYATYLEDVSQDIHEYIQQYKDDSQVKKLSFSQYQMSELEGYSPEPSPKYRTEYGEHYEYSKDYVYDGPQSNTNRAFDSPDHVAVSTQASLSPESSRSTYRLSDPFHHHLPNLEDIPHMTVKQICARLYCVGIDFTGWTDKADLEMKLRLHILEQEAAKEVAEEDALAAGGHGATYECPKSPTQQFSTSPSAMLEAAHSLVSPSSMASTPSSPSNLSDHHPLHASAKGTSVHDQASSPPTHAKSHGLPQPALGLTPRREVCRRKASSAQPLNTGAPSTTQQSLTAPSRSAALARNLRNAQSIGRPNTQPTSQKVVRPVMPQPSRPEGSSGKGGRSIAPGVPADRAAGTNSDHCPRGLLSRPGAIQRPSVVTLHPGMPASRDQQPSPLSVSMVRPVNLAPTGASQGPIPHATDPILIPDIPARSALCQLPPSLMAETPRDDGDNSSPERVETPDFTLPPAPPLSELQQHMRPRTITLWCHLKDIPKTMFLKYGKKGNPHRRFFHVQPHWDGHLFQLALVWHDLWGPEAHGLVQLDELQSVEVSTNARKFQRHLRQGDQILGRKGQVHNARLCFTLHFDKRTLDLLAFTQAEFDLWMAGFNVVVSDNLAAVRGSGYGA
uniref:Alpha-type protein kinase domain-containing protein n=1 Tax=Eutreptiella gymnastica TaxID=73025 RepID=A0A7S1N3Q9_9EUGL|mmetsp:Transcript_115853/g.201572  ORF Transcript_115853/g.201572 Transcript_115853/m.201572 type:complete len:1170 (+) Transcript_115853:64-3573(+)